MGRHKSTSKKKGSQFVIRLDKDERDAFVSLCDKLDTSAAREIRRFMRAWVAANTPAAAADPTIDTAPGVTPAPRPTTASAALDLAAADGTHAAQDAVVEPVAKPKARRKAAAQ